jgi:serine/threonine-protein kinase
VNDLLFEMPEPFYSGRARKVSEWVGGRYRIDKLIADGGMGRVFEATHVALGQKVAIKFLRSELLERSDLVTRFLDEARAFARLRGNHVLRILDVGALPSGAPYMVLEYLEGRDLYSMISECAPIDVETSVDWVLQACEGLAEVHGIGIVHRDIKPENLFLARQPDGRAIIKILDFGISKQCGATAGRSLTNASSPIGSPHYMAPEQIHRPHDVDGRADIWSLGVVLYELVTGKNPFDAPTYPDVCAKVLSVPPGRITKRTPAVTKELESIIFKCLAKHPGKRFGDVAELALALAPYGSRVGRASAQHASRILANVRFDPTQKELSYYGHEGSERQTQMQVAYAARVRPIWRTRAAVGTAACACVAALAYFVQDPGSGRSLAADAARQHTAAKRDVAKDVKPRAGRPEVSPVIDDVREQEPLLMSLFPNNQTPVDVGPVDDRLVPSMFGAIAAWTDRTIRGQRPSKRKSPKRKAPKPPPAASSSTGQPEQPVVIELPPAADVDSLPVASLNTKTAGTDAVESPDVPPAAGSAAEPSPPSPPSVPTPSTNHERVQEDPGPN